MLFTSTDPFRNTTTTAARSTLDYDVVRSHDAVVLHIDIPGIDPAEVDLTVDGRSLVIDASRPELPADDDTSVTSRRRQVSTRQTFQLGTQLDSDKLVADYAFGVLTVTIPVAESAKPRKVTVGLPAETAADPEAVAV